MKVFLLERIGESGYDENLGFVIRARNEAHAREIAELHLADEDKGTWTLASTSTCTVITNAGYMGIILNNFNAFFRTSNISMCI